MNAPFGEPIQSYTYLDEFGLPLHEVLRYSPKTFRQRQVDGYGGHTWGLLGARRVPYNLPAIMDAHDKRRAIVLVEGEKDADALIAAGFVATTNCGGAAWKWTPEFLEHFRGAVRIVVIADSDAPGRKAAQERAQALSALCDDVRVLDLAPDRADGFDVSDWLATGKSARDLQRLMKDAPRCEHVATVSSELDQGTDSAPENWRSRIESASRIALEPPDVIIEDIQGLLPAEDAPGMIYGPPAAMKSWIAMHMCDTAVTGEPFLGRFAVRQRPRAVYVNLDAGAKTFRNRMRRVSDSPGFDCISLASAEFDLSVLREILTEYAGGFVAIDCLSAIYNPDHIKDPAFAMREFIDGVRADYAKFGCGGVIIDHPHRPKERGELGDYHGSVQKEAAFRTMWSVAAETAEPSQTSRRTKISCRKLSEGQPFAPVHVTIEFADERVTFTSGIPDPTLGQDGMERRLIEWAKRQSEAFSRNSATLANQGNNAEKRAAFERLVDCKTFVPTGARRGGAPLFAHADSTSPTQRAMLGEVGEVDRNAPRLYNGARLGEVGKATTSGPQKPLRPLPTPYGVGMVGEVVGELSEAPEPEATGTSPTDHIDHDVDDDGKLVDPSPLSEFAEISARRSNRVEDIG